MDYQFLALYPSTRFGMAPVQMPNGAVTFGAQGSAQWLNPKSASDRALLLSDPLPPLVETDSLAALGQLREATYAPRNQFVVYQHFYPPLRNGLRPVGAMRVDAAAPIAEALRGGPTRSFVLITGGFMRGAIRALGEALEGHELDLLGLFWYYSGDDITDDPEYPAEILDACKRSRVKRLTVLTGAMNASTESRLADGLGNCPELRAVQLCERDEAARYPPFQTPRLDAELSGRKP